MKKEKQNKVSYNEMMKNRRLDSYGCECHAETIEECVCGKFKKIGGDED